MPGGDADDAPDWYLEQLRPLAPVVGPDGEPDLAYAPAGDLFRAGGTIGEKPFEADLLVHDAGVVVQVSTAIAARLAGADGPAAVAGFAAGSGLYPVLPDGGTDDRSRPDRAWVQAVQSEQAVLVLRRDDGDHAVVGLGPLPETLRYGARLLGVMRLDLLVGDTPLLPALTERGIAALSRAGNAWRGVVLTTEQG